MRERGILLGEVRDRDEGKRKVCWREKEIEGEDTEEGERRRRRRRREY